MNDLNTDTNCTRCGSAITTGRGNDRCPACLFAEAMEPDDADESFAGHELIEEIARGGMGVVYRARQRHPAREVALKTLRCADVSSSSALARFEHETRAMAELDHPAILPVFSIGQHDGVPFFTMKLARGGTLADKLGGFAGDWRAIAKLMATVADAVHYAHERGVLHRDIKPANILFDESGHAYVCDFGLAKLADSSVTMVTGSAELLGTPNYLAPEIAAKDASKATTASDVWSLGVVLYELLAQRRPFAGEGVPAVLNAIVTSEPLPFRATDTLGKPPRDLAVIALHALDKEPGRRYRSAREFADDLRRWLEGLPILARPASAVGRLRSWARRKPAVASLAVLLFLSLIGVIGALAHARSTALARLRSSLLDQAHAVRTSTEPNRRAMALSALRAAAAMAPGEDVRDEYVTALALPDFGWEERIEWEGGVSPAFTEDLSRIAKLDQGEVVIAGRDGEIFARVDATPAPVAAIGPFSSDFAMLLVNTTDTTHLWSVREGRWLEFAPGVTAIPRGTEEHFSPNGRYLARNVAQDGSGPVEVYHLTGKTAPVRWNPPWRRGKVAGFSPDSTLLAVRGYGIPEIVVVEPLTGAVRHRLTLPAPAKTRCAAWRPDGGAIAVGTENFKIYLWRLVENSMPVQLLGHNGNVLALDWNADGSRIVSSATEDGTRLWDTSTGALLAEWKWTGRFIACSTDGVEFAAHDDATASTYISHHGTAAFARNIVVPHPDPDESASVGSWVAEFTPDGRRLLTGGTRGISIHDAADGTLKQTYSADYCWALGFPDSTTVVGGTRKGVYRWPLTGVVRVQTPAISFNWPLGVNEPAPVFSGDSTSLSSIPGLTVVTAHDQLHIVRDGAAPVVITAPEWLDRVAIHPAGQIIATGCAKSSAVLFWDLAAPTGSPSSAPRRLAVQGAEPVIHFTSDGTLLLVGDTSGIRAFHTATLAEKWSIPRATRPKVATNIALAANTDLAAADLADGVISLIEPATGRIFTRLIHPFPRDIRHLAISPDGARLAAMTVGHVVQLWELAAVRRELAAHGLDWR